MAQSHGLKLYCGEFGGVRKAPKEDRLRWYSDMIDLFTENQIGYANWKFKSDNFGLVNTGNGAYARLVKIVSEK